MQENIRKIVAAARKARCPILAVPLSVFEFARQEWETTKTSPVVVLAPSTPLRPRQNVTKSVAKARKNTQVTTSQHQPHQQDRRQFQQKTPPPPLFALFRTQKPSASPLFTLDSVLFEPKPLPLHRMAVRR